MRTHCNASTNRKQRVMIQVEHKAGRSLRSLARQLCVSVATVHRWSHRTAPDDRSSRPRCSRSAFTPAEQETILHLRQDRQLPLDDLLNAIEELIPHARRASVHRLLVRRGVSRLRQAKDAGDKTTGVFKDYDPGFVHMDCTYLPRVGDAKQRYCFVALDRATRLMHLAVYDDNTMHSAADFLNQCARRFPFRMTKLLTDNGFEFCVPPNKKATNLSTHPFESLCQERGIEHRKTRPCTPKTNGLVERMNATLKADTVKSTRYESVDDMLKGLAAYPKRFNCERRSTVLGRLTPLQAAKKWYAKKPELFNFNPDHMLTHYCSLPTET
jgi:transposase